MGEEVGRSVMIIFLKLYLGCMYSKINNLLNPQWIHAIRLFIVLAIVPVRRLANLDDHIVFVAC